MKPAIDTILSNETRNRIPFGARVNDHGERLLCLPNNLLMPPPPPNKPLFPHDEAQQLTKPPQKPIPIPPPWPIPKFDLRVEDLSHPGASIFFSNIDPTKSLKAAVVACFQWLYTPESVPRQSVISSPLVSRLNFKLTHSCRTVSN
jgi:hypothetical protein